MKKGILILLLASIIIVLVIFNINNSVSAEVKSKIDFKVELGFDSQYKIGNIVPASIEIQNNLKNINGELQIEIEDNNSISSNIYNNSTSNIAIYTQKVNLPVNSKKQIKMNLPIMKYTNKLSINIVEGEKTIFTKQVDVPIGGNYSNFYIGVLSDDYGSLSYIDKIPAIKNMNVSSKNIKLEVPSLPEDADELNNFNVIIIDNIDTSKFTKAQYNALKKWVYNGGILIIGTGPFYKKTLSIFNDDFLPGKIGAVSAITTNKLKQLVGDTNVDPMTLDVLDVSVTGATSLINDNSENFLQQVTKGKGTIAVASFDLGSEPIKSWFFKEDFGQKILAFSVANNVNILGLLNGGINQNLYSISSSLSNIPELPLVKMNNLWIIFVIYILGVGLISYIVLKKIDRREMMWITIPILSVAFAIIMYFSGISTRITKPVANVISIVNIDNNGSITTNTYAGILTPKNQDIKVSAASGMNIKPLFINNYSNSSSNSVQNSKSKHIDAKITENGSKTIEFYKSGIFASKMVTIDSGHITTGKVECKINYSSGKYIGSVTNKMPYDLINCYILGNNEYINLGSIKKGETKKIDVAGVSFSGQIYDFIRMEYAPYSNVSNMGIIQRKQQISQQQKRLNEQKSDILGGVFQNNRWNVTDYKFIGWGTGTDSKDLIVNGAKVSKYEKSLVVSSVNMTFLNGNQVEYPFGYIKPVMDINSNANSYKMGDSYIGGIGDYEISFKIDTNINISDIAIKYTVRGGNSGVKQYIWDKSLNKYVEGDYRSCSFDGEKLQKYIDNNTIKLKFQIDDQNTNVETPNISVKGVLK